MNFDLGELTANTTGMIVIVALLLIMIAVIVACALLLSKGIKQQIKHNKTVLPTLQIESEKEEEAEEQSAFDVDSVYEVDEEDGFESDEWFAKMREAEGRELAPKQTEEHNTAASMSAEDLMDDASFEEISKTAEAEKPRKKGGMPQL